MRTLPDRNETESPGDLPEFGNELKRPAGACNLHDSEAGPETNLGGSADVDGSAFGQEAGAVAPFRLVEIGCCQYYRYAIIDQVGEDPPELPAGNRVHSVGGFVEDQHFRRVQQ